MKRTAYAVKELKSMFGLSAAGVLYWLKQRGIEHFETESGRVFLDQSQLEQFREKREAALKNWPRGRGRKAESGKIAAENSAK